MSLDLETKDGASDTAKPELLDTAVPALCLWHRLRPWTVVFGAALALGGSLGLEMTYGLWITDYEQRFPNVSRSTLSLIAGVAPPAGNLAAPFAGALVDAVGPRIVLSLGGTCIVAGYLLLSISEQLYAIFLTQGILTGCGLVITFIAVFPTVANEFPQDHRHRGLALATTSAGIGYGGAIVTVLYEVTSHTGAWRDRIVGFFCFSQIMVAILLMPASPEKKKLQFKHVLPDIKHLRNRAFVYAALSKATSYWAAWGMITWFPPMARLVSSAAIEPYLWAISLVCNVLGRVVSGLVGDRIGLVKAYVATTLLLTVVSWATWLPISDTSTLLVFCVLFGLVNGAFQVLTDIALFETVREDPGSAQGWGCFACILVCLSSPSLGVLAIREGALRPYLLPGVIWCSGLLVSSALVLALYFAHAKQRKAWAEGQ